MSGKSDIKYFSMDMSKIEEKFYKDARYVKVVGYDKNGKDVFKSLMSFAELGFNLEQIFDVLNIVKFELHLASEEESNEWNSNI